MKSMLLVTMLMQLFIQMPDKGVSAINFTLTGFDVVAVTGELAEGKVLDWNRIDDKTTKFIIYGGRDVIDNSDMIRIDGYQTASSIKIKDCVGASPDAIAISIYNRYKRG